MVDVNIDTPRKIFRFETGSDNIGAIQCNQQIALQGESSLDFIRTG
jgi:hypothetical protein